jgi:sarcosine oxidase
MSTNYDVIVLGVGGMGSAACLHLARRGARVLGLEQFSLGHDRGSSHGESRIIRQAYFEHPDYVPLLFRAYELWHELEQASGRTLWHPTGLILSGLPEGATIRGATLSASLHHLTLETLTPAAASARWPAFHFPDEHVIAFEPAAGTLLVEACVQAHVDEARGLGADVRANEAVRSWSSDGRSVVVRTDSGEHHACSLIVTAGAWASRCVADLGVSLNVVRKFVGWFPIRAGEFRVEQGVPTFFFELPHGTFYGFPSLDGETIKVAEHSGGEPVDDPASVDRAMHSSDLERLRPFLRAQFPGINPDPTRHAVCLYTLSPDQHFVVDLHPCWRNVAVACGFSGHGFKFAPVMGEALADLVQQGTTTLPIGFLCLNRFDGAHESGER